MSVQLLTEHRKKFGVSKCKGKLSESTLAKILHCWKSYAAAQRTSSDKAYIFPS